MSGNKTDTARLLTLIYKMLAKFRLNPDGDITGVTITKEDINRSVAPNNYIVGDGVKKITVSATPPSNPAVGDLWIDIS